MEPTSIIESGILERYVLGVATENEKKEVELWANKSPQIANLLMENRKALEKYALAFELPSLASVRDKIFNQINMEKQTKEIQLTPNSQIKTWWVAASLLISTASLLANVYYGTQTEKLKGQLSQISKTNNRLTYENLINKANYRSAAEQLSLLHKHGSKTTHLEGLEIAKESSAMIYWNSETKNLYLSIDNLPKAPSGKQYQLWALADGIPVDAGVIEPNAQQNSLIKMKLIDKAQAFAISLENTGGATSPTKNAIFAMGNI